MVELEMHILTIIFGVRNALYILATVFSLFDGLESPYLLGPQMSWITIKVIIRPRVMK